MKHVIRLALAAAAAAAMALPAAADCSKEVADALAKQRTVSAMRQKTRMITERGPVDMTVDYLLPDRMHQTVKALVDPAATETILVGNRGWVSNGAGWQVLPLEQSSELAEEVRKAVIEEPKQMNRYECLGKVEVEGRSLTAYRAVQEKTGAPATTVGTFYVDPVTGLPVRSVMSPPDKPERVFFKQDVTYPQDLKIEPPADAK
jgi:hypothetical protein